MKRVATFAFGLMALVICTVVRPVYADAMLWSVDMSRSRLGFIATQSGAKFEGQFHNFAADIAFSPGDLEHSLIDVEIDMLSVDTQSRDRDSTITTSDWFHTGMFPTARFRTDRFVATGNGRYEAHATLTIRDIGLDVILPFTLTIEDDPENAGRKRAKVSGELDLLRTAWGIGQGQWADTGTVSDKVVVTVDLVAVQRD